MSESFGRVLHIDDEEAIRQSIGAYLEDYGYEVISAENGRIGLEEFGRQVPDIVLVDLRMPEVDGLEVLTYVKQKSPDIPIIVISGTGVIADVIEAIQLGAWNYILKPIKNMDVLLHAVENAFDRVRLIRENKDYQENLEHKIQEQTQELRAKNIELKNSEEFFRSIIENSNDIITIIDKSGKIVYESPSHERVFGYPTGQLINKNTFEYIHPDDKKRLQQQFKDLISRTAETEIFDARLKHNNGSWRYIEGTITNLLHLSSVNGLTVNFRDVTESRILLEQLNQSQKMEAIGQLAGGVAHDFNNLLTVISGYTNLLIMKDDFSPEHKGKLDQIYKAAVRAESLTRQLLAFSRKQIVQSEVVNVNSIIKDSMKMLQRLIGEDIETEIVLADELAPILADPHQFEQILLNLLVNSRDAIQENEKSSLKKRITISTREVSQEKIDTGLEPGTRRNTYIELCIMDTGKGMDEQTIERIFEPFFTTKEQGKGTGLGLSTVYGIVKQNQASIKVFSKPGKGTTFKIYWPIADKGLEVLDKKFGAELSKGNEIILLVEDDDEVRIFGEEVIKSLGYTVHVAENADNALGLLNTEKIEPALLITDIVMPGMNGKELSDKVVKILPGIKTIFTSGYTDNHIIGREFKERNSIFLEKPYSISTISSRIREILDKS